ncbi:THAP domain-containing protein 10-like [Diadema setosum]|uniref:THAP domain-containing protein 10-like n=1 Tax=Diadema setosum TaxID=31175 RepID=UPI003B3A4E41
MPRRCIVAGCSKTAKDGVSLHTFPSDEKLRRIWTARVKLTRVDWNGPSRSSLVCSAHFTDDSFEEGLHQQFQIERLRRLKADALPVITLQNNGESLKRPRSGNNKPARPGAEKRRKMKILGITKHGGGASTAQENTRVL